MAAQLAEPFPSSPPSVPISSFHDLPRHNCYFSRERPPRCLLLLLLSSASSSDSSPANARRATSLAQ
ncbi:hypothetical protein Droror1_Dr00016315, partial [Drosera rotundifolia]